MLVHLTVSKLIRCFVGASVSLTAFHAHLFCQHPVDKQQGKTDQVGHA